MIENLADVYILPIHMQTREYKHYYLMDSVSPTQWWWYKEIRTGRTR